MNHLALPPHPHSPACALCHRFFTPDADELQPLPVPIPICGDCKFLLLDDHDSPVQEDYRAVIHRLRGGGGGAVAGGVTRRRRRYFGSSESVEASFSQARQSTSYDDYENSIYRASRWRRGVSDTESDGFDSFLGESESNFSFSSSRFLHDENDSFSVGDGEGGSDDDAFLEDETDNDIDPMHAGLYHWNSQDIEEDEYIVWEESDGAPFGEGYYRSSPRNYVEGREFDELLEHLAQVDSSARGAPPAAISFVRQLPRLVVTEDHQDELGCAICKDPLHIGAVVNQLPCSHLYHPSCILPWLSSRNSCPLCRYELPTDDRDYEDRKRRNEEQQAMVEVNQEDSSSSSDEEEEEDELDAPERERGENAGRRGWIFLAAAAPVVGAILMFCFGSPERRWRATGTGRHQTHCLPLRDSGHNRGWWFLF